MIHSHNIFFIRQRLYGKYGINAHRSPMGENRDSNILQRHAHVHILVYKYIYIYIKLLTTKHAYKSVKGFGIKTSPGRIRYRIYIIIYIKMQLPVWWISYYYLWR